MKTINDLINAPYGKVYPVILTESAKRAVLNSLREDLEALRNMQSAGTGLTKEFVLGVKAEIREIEAQLLYYSGPHTSEAPRNEECKTSFAPKSCPPCTCVTSDQCAHAGVRNA